MPGGGRPKLNENKVRDLFHDWNVVGMTVVALAAKYGISRQAVYNIINGVSWTHVTRHL